MVYGLREGRGEFIDLILPVEHQRGWAYHEVFRVFIRVLIMLEESKRLHSLTQTHIIGEYSTPAGFIQEFQPLESGKLVRS